MSAAIERLLAITRSLGLECNEGSWSAAKVHHVDGLMPVVVRSAGQADVDLEYFKQDSDPHYDADEGFIDNVSKTAISFPLRKQPWYNRLIQPLRAANLGVNR